MILFKPGLCGRLGHGGQNKVLWSPSVFNPENLPCHRNEVMTSTSFLVLTVIFRGARYRTLHKPTPSFYFLLIQILYPWPFDCVLMNTPCTPKDIFRVKCESLKGASPAA